MEGAAGRGGCALLVTCLFCCFGVKRGRVNVWNVPCRISFLLMYHIVITLYNNQEATGGWLEGDERMRALAALVIAT